MKNKFPILVLLIFATSKMVYSQEKSNTTYAPQKQLKNVISLAPFSIATGIFEFNYERVITKKGSLDFNSSYTNGLLYNGGFFDDNNIKANIFTLSAGYKHYFIRHEDKPRGFYGSLAIYSEYGYGSFNRNSNPTTQLSAFAIGPQIKVGYQFIFDRLFKGFSLDLAIVSNKLWIDIEDEPSQWLNIRGGVGILLGYSF